jgi:hypothetical protein
MTQLLGEDLGNTSKRGDFKPNIIIWVRRCNMAEQRPQPQNLLFTQDELKEKLKVSNFDPNVILRGAQLTVVGGKPMHGHSLPSVVANHIPSSSSITEPKALHIRTLQAGSYCCGRWYCNQGRHRDTGMCPNVSLQRGNWY